MEAQDVKEESCLEVAADLISKFCQIYKMHNQTNWNITMILDALVPFLQTQACSRLASNTRFALNELVCIFQG